jgi:hypothetical protein
MAAPIDTYLYHRFQVFHESHPEVYLLVERFARQARRAGYQHYGMGAVFERIRWHLNVDAKAEDGLGLNNNHRAYYARMLEEDHPEFRGFFRNRRVKGETG